MFSPDQYELLDFGAGRRLERFGPLVLDRPCPSADDALPYDAAAWEHAAARFERTGTELGEWRGRDELPERWSIAHGRIVLEMKRTEFGHLGVFPEQAENWDWIAAQAAAHAGPLRVLNLFAYTGGSTLAAAAAGAEVTHVDAAKNIVAWARQNARLSGLETAPVRWIAEDAMKFVQREIRRGRVYDAVILDPPSYGHGAGGETWQLARHLAQLLQLCREVTASRLRFLLLTCHTPGYEADRLCEMLRTELGEGGRLSARPLTIYDRAGRALPSGAVGRWERGER